MHSRYFNPLFQNYCPFILFLSLFQGLSQSQGHDQQSGKLTQCRSPNQLFRINFMDMPSQVRAFSFSILFVNFYLNPDFYISPWLEKMFKLMMLRLLENAIVSQKIGSREITHAPALSPKVKLPQVLTITLPGRENYSSLWQQFFEFSFPHKKRGKERKIC